MNLFGKKDELIAKLEDNLKIAQQNNEMLLKTLNQIVQHDKKNNEVLELDKFNAAYALNLCTVSVSQIIEYNDINFMEREYEAILNNLNLENIPKDEALLHILKQLLDVITFFRIQDKEKQLLEQEYQQKIKNAIWSAIPNLSITVGTSLLATGISLASQVGIGYMNYRKEKARVNLEKERCDWELQKSAIEQFNGLRRELFDTAWRLADKYEFNDEFRITERQITQFNQILLDTDDLRKYERLKYVEDKFQAYPPFLYYLGNAANSVYQNNTYSEEIRNQYKKYAKNAFDRFLELTDHNLLREDQLEASCALELFDLLDLVEKKQRKDLLLRAQNSSGNAFDVVQICAMSYLQIGENLIGEQLLRMLVNENYNKVVNAQLLSRLYVSHILENDNKGKYQFEYATLEDRCDDVALFPAPSIELLENGDINKLNDEFAKSNKEYLLHDYINCMKEYIIRFENEYDRICTCSCNLIEELTNLFNNMCNGIKYLGEEKYIAFKDELQYQINKKENSIKNMVERHMENSTSTMLLFREIAAYPFYAISEIIGKQIYEVNNIEILEELQTSLDDFVSNNNLHKISYSTKKRNISISNSITLGKFNKVLFEKDELALQNVERYLNNVLSNENKIKLYKYDSIDYKSYLYRHNVPVREKVLVVINDMTAKDTDLIITSYGIGVFQRGTIRFDKKTLRKYAPYDKIDASPINDALDIDGYTYKNDKVNITILYEFVKQMRKVKTSQDDSNHWVNNVERKLRCYL